MGWLRRLFGTTRDSATKPAVPAAAGIDPPGETDMIADEEHQSPLDLVVELPITDALDLHPFRPSETADVLRDYLDAAIDKGLREVRVIHGRGIGTQREIVRKVLSRDPRVLAFADAPADRGGWGATVVELRSEDEPSSSG